MHVLPVPADRRQSIVTYDSDMSMHESPNFTQYNDLKELCELSKSRQGSLDSHSQYENLNSNSHLNNFRFQSPQPAFMQQSVSPRDVNSMNIGLNDGLINNALGMGGFPLMNYANAMLLKSQEMAKSLNEKEEYAREKSNECNNALSSTPTNIKPIPIPSQESTQNLLTVSTRSLSTSQPKQGSATSPLHTQPSQSFQASQTLHALKLQSNQIELDRFIQSSTNNLLNPNKESIDQSNLPSPNTKRMFEKKAHELPYLNAFQPVYPGASPYNPYSPQLYYNHTHPHSHQSTSNTGLAPSMGMGQQMHVNTNLTEMRGVCLSDPNSHFNQNANLFTLGSAQNSPMTTKSASPLFLNQSPTQIDHGEFACFCGKLIKKGFH